MKVKAKVENIFELEQILTSSEVRYFVL